MRQALMVALQAIRGGKSIFRATTSTSDLRALVSHDPKGAYYVLLTNKGETAHSIDVNLPMLGAGTVEVVAESTLFRMDVAHANTIESGPSVSSGVLHLDVNPWSVTCVRLSTSR